MLEIEVSVYDFKLKLELSNANAYHIKELIANKLMPLTKLNMHP